jgi:hypothetical protein
MSWKLQLTLWISDRTVAVKTINASFRIVLLLVLKGDESWSFYVAAPR